MQLSRIAAWHQIHYISQSVFLILLKRYYYLQFSLIAELYIIPFGISTNLFAQRVLACKSVLKKNYCDSPPLQKSNQKPLQLQRSRQRRPVATKDVIKS